MSVPSRSGCLTPRETLLYSLDGRLSEQCGCCGEKSRQTQSYIATDGRSISKSWCRAPYYCLTVTVLFLWTALSDERTGLSFVYAAGPRQRSLSRVRVPWISRPYFTVSVLRLPFSSPPTTHMVTVEVFYPAFTPQPPLYSLGTDGTENISPNISSTVVSRSYCTDRAKNTVSKLLHCYGIRICFLATGVFAEPFPSNGCFCWIHSSCLEKIRHNI
jgi:hypothetical protein